MAKYVQNYKEKHQNNVTCVFMSTDIVQVSFLLIFDLFYTVF